MSGNTWTAVIIEDDPDVRDLIDIVLTQSGFSTVVVGDGTAGVEAVRTHNPLITTLDINMPGMDGFAAAKRLREFSDTYLIFITSLGDEIDVVQGFEAGGDDYLVKPFRPRELRARADSMLRRPRTRQDHPSGPAEAPAPPPEPVAPQEESWAAKAARELTAGVRLRPAGERQVAAPTAGAPAAPAPAPAAPAPAAAAPVPAAAAPVPAPAAAAAPAAPAPAPAPRAAAPAPAPAPAPVAAPEPAPVLAPAPQAPVPAPAPAPAPEPAPARAAVVHASAPAVSGSAPTVDGATIRFNGLVLNQETRLVSVRGASVDLTRVEFDLLASLLGTGRRVRSKADLVLTMRGQQYVTSYFVNEADKRSVETNMTNLRRKLGDDGASPKFVETVRGVGYRLAEV